MSSTINDWKRSTFLALAVCLLLGFVVGGGARAEESPLIEHIDQLMLDIGAQLTNAKMRLTRSSGVVEENPNGESGIGLTCCTNNLRTIADKLRIIRASIDRLAVYYSGQQNGTAMSILGELDSRLLSISTGAAIFGRAPDTANASAALTGFIRPWNGFRNGIETLRRCCPVPLPVEPESVTELDEGESEEQDEKRQPGKNGKKRKKKQPKDDANNSDGLGD